jgi:hypothetical protein
MGEAKVNVGVKIPPAVKAALERQAAREDKTLSKLCEVLLSWAHEQIQIAGNSFVLKTWEAQPPPSAASGRPGIYQQVTEQAEEFARAARHVAERPHEGGHGQRHVSSEKDASRQSGRSRRRAHP